ncbi:type IV pilin protein [Pseudoxanthomonas sp. UTMC 1351]|uniref:type IV pilin protein n=1 Tax=Pseudoxanthomonas sp. UTMC 1351 TaxID=2695853 RepID=UPI0034CD8851
MSTAPNMASRNRSVAGFTLLELMIVVAIVAILSTIAYASYQDQIIKSRRAAGAACLQERAQYMERYYTTYLSYNAVPAPAIAECDNEVRPHYQVVPLASAAGARTFTLQAIPQGVQATKDTLCGTLTINQQGVRGESGTAATADECW